MRRTSWVLETYELPKFNLYDHATKLIGDQVPIDENDRPKNESYFIGIPEGQTAKLLCYHIKDGKYIVVSYNYNSAILLKNIKETLYTDDDTNISIKKETDENPDIVINKIKDSGEVEIDSSGEVE